MQAVVTIACVFLFAFGVQKCSQFFEIGAHDPNWPGHGRQTLVDCDSKYGTDNRALMECYQRAGELKK